MKKSLVLFLIVFLGLNPCFALDFDSVDTNSSRKTYSTNTQTKPQTTQPSNSIQIPTAQPVSSTVKTNTVQQQIVTPEPQIQDIQHFDKLPNVPKLPDKAFSKTVAPINTMYTGKVPDKNAITPCNDIKVEDLILDKQYTKPKLVNIITPKQSTPKTVTKQPTKQSVANYKYKRLAKGTQIRVVSTSKISDYLCKGQRVVFKTTQEVRTPYFNIPKGAKFTAVVEDSHRPQITCNGGLVALRFTNAEINGYNQSIDASIIKIKLENVHLGNLKGAHTYWKTTCKKAKWGQTKFKQWSNTSSKLASNGPGSIIAPFPYIGGVVLACASTISSPVTAIFGKGGSLSIPANTVFTIRLNEEAKIRY